MMILLLILVLLVTSCSIVVITMNDPTVNLNFEDLIDFPSRVDTIQQQKDSNHAEDYLNNLGSLSNF